MARASAKVSVRVVNLPYEMFNDAQFFLEEAKKLNQKPGDIDIYKDQEPFGVNIKNAEKGIEMVRLLVKYLSQLSSMEYPSWINQNQSQVIK